MKDTKAFFDLFVVEIISLTLIGVFLANHLANFLVEIISLTLIESLSSQSLGKY